MRLSKGVPRKRPAQRGDMQTPWFLPFGIALTRQNSDTWRTLSYKQISLALIPTATPVV